jgi:pyridoxal phosphate enzyme (YggS family)
MLKENLEKIFLSIKDGNNLGEEITLVGATKMVSPDVINDAVALGLKVVAENKVQEFNLKHDLITKTATQHFIGHLQTNKVKYLVGKIDLIQSVDSLHLASEINKQACKKQIIQNIHLEVNIGGELSKSGFNHDNAFSNALQIAKDCPNLKIKGLMAMLPKVDNNDLLATLTKKMRDLFDSLKEQGLPFEHLSIGMSGDYTVAIKNGSNMIRIGSSLFGARS